VIPREPGLCPDYMSLRTILERLFTPPPSDDLRERIEKLEKRMLGIDMEWTDVYDKFRNLHMRVARRVKVLEANSSQEEPQGAESEEHVTPTGPLFSSLSPRAQEVQRQILQRRNRGNGGVE